MRCSSAYGLALVLAALLTPSAPAAAGGTYYQQPDEFLAEVFDDAIPLPAVLWITGDLKAQVASILGHEYGRLRVRYWNNECRTAWILEEIGKVKPITVGLVVDGAALERMDILAFRESRGWEVKFPFFTKQFHGTTLKSDHELSHEIDGITGATLSVRAVTKLARMALLLHRVVCVDEIS